MGCGGFDKTNVFWMFECWTLLVLVVGRKDDGSFWGDAGCSVGGKIIMIWGFVVVNY